MRAVAVRGEMLPDTLSARFIPTHDYNGNNYLIIMMMIVTVIMMKTIITMMRIRRGKESMMRKICGKESAEFVPNVPGRDASG